MKKKCEICGQEEDYDFAEYKCKKCNVKLCSFCFGCEDHECVNELIEVIE